MQAAEGRIGRVFVLRLEDGDRIPECIERFAAANGLLRAQVSMLGGVGGGRLVVGPEDGAAERIVPMTRALDAVYEAAAVGTLFPDESGAPRLHMHAALGRGREPLAGCVRQGLEVWKIGEVVLLEILGTMRRVVDPAFGFEVLDVGQDAP